MQNIFFLRHCLTELNAQHRISGSMDSDLERNACVKNVEQIYGKSLILFSSDLLRCKKTMNLLEKEMQCRQKIYYFSSLRERNMGDFEGKSREKLQGEYPQFFLNGRFRYEMTPPNGEQFQDVLYRVNTFINEELKKNEGKDILICGHNQILKVLWCRLLDNPIDQMYEKIDFPCGSIIKIC